MISIVTTVLGVIFKVAQFAAKVALNRTTVIITFVGGMLATMRGIYVSLEDLSMSLSESVDVISVGSIGLSNWVSHNEYAQMIGYALSLEELLDGCISSFVMIFSAFVSILFTVVLNVFLAVLPLISDLSLSAIKTQMARSTSLSSS